jgi:hypothetical protein
MIGDILAVVSSRYAEDLDFVSGMPYARSAEEPGFEFGVLTRKDRQNLLADMVDWRGYGHRGMSHDQQSIVIANVLDGKPQEKWLEGVFDEAVLENARIISFRMSVENMKNSPVSHQFEEMNGDRRPWDDLSAAAKLQYIALDAARNDVPLESFAEVVKDAIGDRVDAALRVVLESQKELHAISQLFPDDGRTEPRPFVEQMKDMLDYVLLLEGITRQQLAANTELKDHGKSKSLASCLAPPTTDAERRLAWMETIRGLDAAYTAGGTDALAKMNGIEIHVLYDEKMAELGAVRKGLAEHGDSEISQLHKLKLERQTADMALWMRVHCPDFRDMEEAKGLEVAVKKEGKISLADLRDKTQGKQPEKETTKDKGLER